MPGRPVCTDCGLEMKCIKNSYVIGYKSGRRYESDRFECPDCSSTVALMALKPHPEPTEGREPVPADCMVSEPGYE